MKKTRRNLNDAIAPIVKPCFVDVETIWKNAENKRSVSNELSDRVLRALLAPAQKAR